MSITTFRMKLGDWVSGGRWSRWNADLTRTNDGLVKVLLDSRDGLREIAALETPKAAHSVKKATRIAREALGKGLERL